MYSAERAHFQDVQMRAVNRAQIAVGAVAGEGRQHLDTHALEEIPHDFLVALDIVLTDVVDDVIAGDLRFDVADLLIDPGDVDLVVPARLAGTGEDRRVADGDVDLGHLPHHLVRDRADVVADQGRRAGLVDRHAPDVRKRLERRDDVLLQYLLGTENDALLLHVGGDCVVKLEIVVVGDAALGLPSVVGAADRAVADVDHVLHRRADDVLGPAIGAAAFRDRTGDGVEVSERRGVGQGLARPLDDAVLFPLRNGLGTFEKVMRHDGPPLGPRAKKARADG